jgi:hypothetical protein
LIQANASLDSLEATGDYQPPMPAREYIDRVFQENPVSPADDPASDGHSTKARSAKRPPANQRSRSRTDPDASVISRTTFGLHLAYKAHVAVDDHPARVITAALVTPGATADEYMAEQLFAQHCHLEQLVCFL